MAFDEDLHGSIALAFLTLLREVLAMTVLASSLASSSKGALGGDDNDINGAGNGSKLMTTRSLIIPRFQVQLRKIFHSFESVEQILCEG